VCSSDLFAFLEQPEAFRNAVEAFLSR